MGKLMVRLPGGNGEATMTSRSVTAARCAALVGPYTSGKTTLLEALLLQAGALHRKGSVAEGSALGDPSPDARARQLPTEPHFAPCTYLEATWSFNDFPGPIDPAHDLRSALMAARVAAWVAPAGP